MIRLSAPSLPVPLAVAVPSGSLAGCPPSPGQLEGPRARAGPTLALAKLKVLLTARWQLQVIHCQCQEGLGLGLGLGELKLEGPRDQAAPSQRPHSGWHWQPEARAGQAEWYQSCQWCGTGIGASASHGEA
jgi:hypothetical protein